MLSAPGLPRIVRQPQPFTFPAAILLLTGLDTFNLRQTVPATRFVLPAERQRRQETEAERQRTGQPRRGREPDPIDETPGAKAQTNFTDPTLKIMTTATKGWDYCGNAWAAALLCKNALQTRHPPRAELQRILTELQ